MAQSKVPGTLLLCMGALLLLYKVKVVPIYTFFTWSFIFLLIGIGIVVVALVRKIPPAALVGGLISSVSLFIWGRGYIDGWSDHWSLLFIMFGISVLLMYYLNRQTSILLIGTMILLVGLFAFPGLKAIPLLSPLSPLLNTYWPLLLIGLGITLVARRR